MHHEFDVFFSYNSRNKTAVVELANELNRREVRVWLDERELAPGQAWQEELEQIISTVPTAAVLIGSDDLGPWQKPEVQALLGERVERRMPVIPVLLPGGQEKPKLPAFLRSFVWVDLREGLTTGGLDRLVWGITGKKPEPKYPDDSARKLSEDLEAAYLRKAELEASGGDTTEVVAEILERRRRLREGAQLKEGAFLADGRYQLLERIGQGGFARVWKAYDRQSRSLVAVKVLHGQHSEDRTRRERFFRGAQQMARLQHSGIVRVIEERKVDGGYSFFVMEYVGGGNFREVVLDGRLSLEERLQIVLKVGEALAFAHEHGIIHRDVKPTNIVLDTSGRPKLTDFDLVWAADTTGGTRSGSMGSIPYAAPEMFRRPQNITAAVDVFGLGMTTIFALFGEDLDTYIVMRQPENIIAELEIPVSCQAVLSHTISFDSIGRPPSAREFCHALKEGFTKDVLIPAIASIPLHVKYRSRPFENEAAFDVTMNSSPFVHWSDDALIALARGLELDGVLSCNSRKGRLATLDTELQATLSPDLRNLEVPGPALAILATCQKLADRETSTIPKALVSRIVDTAEFLIQNGNFIKAFANELIVAIVMIEDRYLSTRQHNWIER